MELGYQKALEQKDCYSNCSAAQTRTEMTQMGSKTAQKLLKNFHILINSLLKQSVNKIPSLYI
jgi:hypothetical protein